MSEMDKLLERTIDEIDKVSKKNVWGKMWNHCTFLAIWRTHCLHEDHSDCGLPAYCTFEKCPLLEGVR